MFGAGLLAFPTGVGLGLPYLAKTGLSPVTVVGLALLVVGALLLVAGAMALVRGCDGWRRYLVTLPGVLVAVLVATATLGQAVALTAVPPTTVGRASPTSFGLGYRDVEFTTPTE
jgi:hypothetical protein